MGAFVLLHGVPVTEAAAAERAAVGTLSRVDAEVAPQVSSLTEALGAVGAAVRPLSRVRPEVAPQIRRLSEGLAAEVTAVRLLLLLEMEAQLCGGTERLATTRAALRVRQRRRDGERLDLKESNIRLAPSRQNITA